MRSASVWTPEDPRTSVNLCDDHIRIETRHRFGTRNVGCSMSTNRRSSVASTSGIAGTASMLPQPAALWSWSSCFALPSASPGWNSWLGSPIAEQVRLNRRPTSRNSASARSRSRLPCRRHSIPPRLPDSRLLRRVRSAILLAPVSYTHLTLPTNREV